MEGRDVGAFADAGRTLFSLGLVKGSEGNLSTWDGHELQITRSGCELGTIRTEDVVTGTLDDPPSDASTDLLLHIARYRERGPGAVAHAHPAGTVPRDWIEGMHHGDYAFAPTLADAVAEIVRRAREAAS